MKQLSMPALDALRAQRDNGLLGVVAARARVSESHLFHACDDGCLMFTDREAFDIEEALGVELDAATFSSDMEIQS